MPEELIYAILLNAPGKPQYVDRGYRVNRFDLPAMIALAAGLAQADGQTYLVEQFYTTLPGVPGKIVHRTAPGLALPTTHRATYTNGNREITIRPDGDRFALRSNVWDGTKWQYGAARHYQTFTNAQRAAVKEVAKISAGWTAQPEWIIT